MSISEVTLTTDRAQIADFQLQKMSECLTSDERSLPPWITTSTYYALIDWDDMFKRLPVHHAGVIGVAVTGFILDQAGEGTRGWWQAFIVASALCWGGSVLFLTSAHGERLFGDLSDF